MFLEEHQVETVVITFQIKAFHNILHITLCCTINSIIVRFINTILFTSLSLQIYVFFINL